jgi:hypothetical protein
MVSRFALAALMFCAAPGVPAAEVAGVKLEDRTKVGATDLVLNGAGVRTRAIFKVYAIGLYLGEKKPGAADVIGASGAKRVAIHMLRDVDAATFTEALVEGMRPNHDEATMKALEPRIAELCVDHERAEGGEERNDGAARLAAGRGHGRQRRRQGAAANRSRAKISTARCCASGLASARCRTT